MGVELIIIGIIAGASVLISGISATVSIGTIFHFTKKFKSTEKVESKDTTNVTIKNEAIKEENADGSSKTTRKQEINITDIDMDIGSKLISGSTTITRTGLPNETAEILAKGGVGALNKLTAEVLPQISSLIESDPKAEVGLDIIEGGMKLMKSEPVLTEKVASKAKRLEKDSEPDGDHDVSSNKGQQITNHSTEEANTKNQADNISAILQAVVADQSEESVDKDAIVLGENIEESASMV